MTGDDDYMALSAEAHRIGGDPLWEAMDYILSNPPDAPTLVLAIESLRRYIEAQE